MDRIAVLQYCLQLLAEREASDPHQAWFWALRRKAVGYCIMMLRLQSDRVRPSRSLSAAEKEFVASTHPLLADRKTFAPAHGTREYMRELHRRAKEYFDSLTPVRTVDDPCS